MRDYDLHPRIDAFLDGELDPAASQAVEAHLAGCAACRDRAASARRLDEALGEPLPPLPPAFAVGARARAERRGLPLAPLWWRVLPVAWRAGLAALAAVSLLAGARLGRAVATDRAAAAELAAALDAPATATLLGGAAPGPAEARR